MSLPAAADQTPGVVDVRFRARAAGGDLLTAVLAQADLPAATVHAVVSRLAPAGRAVTVERLAVLLDQLGFALQLTAIPTRQDIAGDAGVDIAGDAGAEEV